MLDARWLMSDTVERIVRGEVQRLWLANIPLFSNNLYCVGDAVVKVL